MITFLKNDPESGKTYFFSRISTLIHLNHLVWLHNSKLQLLAHFRPNHGVFTPRQKAKGVLLWAVPSVPLLTFQFFRTTGRISWWIITIFGLWVVGRWGKRKMERFFEIHTFWVKNGKISNRNCAFLPKSVFLQYRVHFFMDHDGFGFVSWL